MKSAVKKLLSCIGICVCLLPCAAMTADVENPLVSKDTGNGRCIDIKHKDFYKFIESPEKWKKEVFSKNYLLRPCVRGKALKDLDGALGIYMEKAPEIFFDALHANKETDLVIAGIVQALPQNLSVDNDKKQERLQSRKSIIEKSTLSCCEHERDVALKAIDDGMHFSAENSGKSSATGPEIFNGNEMVHKIDKNAIGEALSPAR